MAAPRNGQGNVTADRAARLLLLYDDSRPVLSAAEVAEHLGMSRSTTYRYLLSLRAAGLLEEDAVRGNFRLGPRIFELARVARKGLGLTEVAVPAMRRLMEETGETVFLTRRSGTHVICVECEESGRNLHAAYERGQLLPMHAGASAIVLLAWLESGELDRILQAVKLERYTDAATTTDANLLRARLGEIRKIGYAISFGELEPGAVEVAAPIRDEAGTVTAGLSVVIPSHRADERSLQGAITGVRSYADRVTQQLREIAP
jgi:DNA-binding IclR family transcriptional regulator